MTPTDLTPRTYLQRIRIHSALRGWSIAAALCGLASVSALLLNAGRGPDIASARTAERLQLAESRITKARQSTKALELELKTQERALQAERHLTQRPDWSAVIQVVAKQFDGKLVMKGFHLGQAEENNVRTALGQLSSDVPGDSVWLIVTGVAESNSDVPGLILRLERLGLFKRVVMTGNQREVFAGQPRTGFTLACRVE